ncbi:Hsp70 family protein [Actinoplanes sp. NPDC023801]|uniref:Hsp70 family protein n=1 Tax=Actinoplanes sp. NPDC023801 TaxID=3154595 RepID=UPI0033CD9554
MTAQYGLGIDLGTTHTAAAVLTGGRVESVRLGTRRMEIPSTVFAADDGVILVGEAAERRGQDEPGRLAREFKRRMGDPVPIIAGGVPFSAQALTAKLLRHVLDTVTRQQGAPPADVALTYPAHWGQFKRERLDEAIRLADIGPVRLLTEPEAVARRHARARRIEPGQTVVVYDLGGGTFDVAVLRREGDGFELLGIPEGVDQLGGADFDAAVFAHMLAAIDGGVDQSDPETVPALARLRRDCVEAKESLSFDTEVTVPVAVPGRYARVKLSRAEFEAMIAPSVQDTVEATRRALRSAGVSAGELTAVLMAGGSSRIPMIARVLGEQFGGRVGADSHPEHSVAIGAAWSTGLSVAPVTTAARAKVVAGGAGGVKAADDVRTVKAAAGAAPVSPAPAAGNGRPREEAGSDSTAAAAPDFTATAAAAPEFTATGAATGAAAGGPGAEAAPGGAASTVPHGGGTPAGIAPAAAGWGLQPVVRHDEFTDLKTPADPWAMAEAAEAAAADAEAAAATTTHIPTPRVPEEAAPDASTHFLPGASYPSVPPLPAPAARRRRGIIVAAGTAVFVLAAASGVALSHLFDPEDKKDVVAAPSTGPSASAPAGPSATPPTETMLIRVDTGEFQQEDWAPKIQQFNPNVKGPSDLPGTEPGDTLPRWSKDRTQIAVTKRNNKDDYAIYVMKADGTERREVVGGVTPGRAAWNTDGTKLAFVKKDDDGVNQIFIATIDSDEAPEQLTKSKNGKDDPVWSTDGSAIIYFAVVNGVSSIYRLDIASRVEPGRAITKPSDGNAVDPAISPDGTHVLYVRKPYDHDDPNSDIWIIPAAGGEAVQLTEDPAREVDPSWAPDSHWFAFARGTWDLPKIVVMRKDLGVESEQVLTTGDAREGHPCWT